MHNPMIASGDIIYGGTDGNPTKLAKGTNAQVLTLAAGLPSWAAAAGGGSMTNWIIDADATGPKTIADGETLDIAGGTGISTALGGAGTPFTLTVTNDSPNVSTALSVGTVGINTVAITSDGGADDVTLPAATVAAAGMLTTAKWAEIVANNGKNTNVSTTLSTGTVDGTSYGITSDSGVDDVVLAQADTANAGVLSAAKWDEIVANSLKATNVVTNLSAGTRAPTTIDVNSSDGTNATLVEADTTNAGILGSDKWDEIVANTLAKHTQNTDTALGSGCVAADHGTAATDQVINVSYGTGAAPAANTTTIGALYITYTA